MFRSARPGRPTRAEDSAFDFALALKFVESEHEFGHQTFKFIQKPMGGIART